MDISEQIAEDKLLRMILPSGEKQVLSLGTGQLERFLVGAGSNFYTLNLNKNWGKEEFSKIFALLETTT